MRKKTPYLVVRADTWFFRIAVPVDLRGLVGCRELTRTLRTTDKASAVPRALELAAKSIGLFNELRGSMGSNELSPKMRKLIEEKRNNIQLDRKRAGLEVERGDDFVDGHARLVTGLVGGKPRCRPPQQAGYQ